MLFAPGGPGTCPAGWRLPQAIVPDAVPSGKRRMKYRTCRKWLPMGTICALFLGLTVVSTAAEQPQRFVEALRQRGYYDTALEYLEHARASSSAGSTRVEATVFPWRALWTSGSEARESPV